MNVIDVSAKPTEIEVPLSLQSAPALIEKRRGKSEDATFDKMITAAGDITETATKVKTAVEKILGNQMAMPIKRTADAKQVASKIFQRVAGKLDDVRKDAQQTIAALEAATLPPAPKDAPAALYHGEVRTALLKMTPTDRAKAIRAAIKTGDDAFAAAVILGNTALTGLSQSERDALADEWRRTRHKDTIERMERLRNGLAEYDRLCALARAAMEVA
jgi:hypothetical protein